MNENNGEKLTTEDSIILELYQFTQSEEEADQSNLHPLPSSEILWVNTSLLQKLGEDKPALLDEIKSMDNKFLEAQRERSRLLDEAILLKKRISGMLKQQAADLEEIETLKSQHKLVVDQLISERELCIEYWKENLSLRDDLKKTIQVLTNYMKKQRNKQAEIIGRTFQINHKIQTIAQQIHEFKQTANFPTSTKSSCLPSGNLHKRAREKSIPQECNCQTLRNAELIYVRKLIKDKIDRDKIVMELQNEIKTLKQELLSNQHEPISLEPSCRYGISTSAEYLNKIVKDSFGEIEILSSALDSKDLQIRNLQKSLAGQKKYSLYLYQQLKKMQKSENSNATSMAVSEKAGKLEVQSRGEGLLRLPSTESLYVESENRISTTKSF